MTLSSNSKPTGTHRYVNNLIIKITENLLKMKPKIKITKRDLQFFVAGIAFTAILSLILNWKENTRDFKEGFNEGYKSTQKGEINH